MRKMYRAAVNGNGWVLLFVLLALLVTPSAQADGEVSLGEGPGVGEIDAVYSYVCFDCVEHEFPFPEGNETLHICLGLGGAGGTDCWEINNGQGCVVWFPGSCSTGPPRE